jgi:transposase InsO family protein
MDWATRKVLSWRISNTMQADFRVDTLKEAIWKYGPPEIMNMDQASQFTGADWITTLTDARVRVSMDGRGRYLDNMLASPAFGSSDACSARPNTRLSSCRISPTALQPSASSTGGCTSTIGNDRTRPLARPRPTRPTETKSNSGKRPDQKQGIYFSKAGKLCRKTGPVHSRDRLSAQGIHVVLDNLSTHKRNEAWLKRHPDVHFHFTPTSASWLSQIENWFSILPGKSLAGASFTSVAQLKDHIDAFIASYNEGAAPFVWTKTKVRQRKFKNRGISQLWFRVSGAVLRRDGAYAGSGADQRSSACWSGRPGTEISMPRPTPPPSTPPLSNILCFLIVLFAIFVQYCTSKRDRDAFRVSYS